MPENNLVDSTKKDIEQMTQVGKSAYNTTKKTVKTAQKVASHINWFTVKIIAGALVIFVLLYALSALPNALFATAESVVDQWESVYFTDENDGDRFKDVGDFLMSLAVNTGSFLKDKISDIAKALNFGLNDAEDNTAYLSGQDIDVFTSEAESKLTLIKLALAVNNKYLVRANHVDTAIMEHQSEIEEYLANIQFSEDSWLGSNNEIETYDDYEVHFDWNTSGIYGIQPLGTDNSDKSTITADEAINRLQSIIDQMRNAETIEEATELNEKFEETIGIVFPFSSTDDEPGNIGAISLISLFSVQNGTTSSSLKQSDLMKYMGYSGGVVPTYNTTFDIGGVDRFTGKVKDWKGSFMPQYLMEELNYYRSLKDEAETYLEIYQNENSEQVNTMNDLIAEYNRKISAYEDQGVALMDLIVTVDFPNLNLATQNLDNEDITTTEDEIVVTEGNDTKWSPNEISTITSTTYTYQAEGSNSSIIRNDCHVHIVQTWSEWELLETEWVQEPVASPEPDEVSSVATATPAPSNRPWDYPSEDPDEGYEWVKKYRYGWVTHEREIEKMIRTYTINYLIYPKEITSFLELVGLRSGNFSAEIGSGDNQWNLPDDDSEISDVIPSISPDDGDWSTE